MRRFVVLLAVTAFVSGCTKYLSATTEKVKPLKQQLAAKIANDICGELAKFYSLERQYRIPSASQRVLYKGNMLELENGVVRCTKGVTKQPWSATVNIKDERDLTKKSRYYVYRSGAAEALCGELRKMNQIQRKYKVPAQSHRVVITNDGLKLESNALVCRTTNEELRAYISI